MKQQKIFLIVLMVLCFALVANGLVAQEHFPTLTGTVVGIEGGARKWLEVKSETDGETVNFRIGRNTTYVPQRYPNVGEKVRILYFVEKGVNVASKVLIFKDSAN